MYLPSGGCCGVSKGNKVDAVGGRSEQTAGACRAAEGLNGVRLLKAETPHVMLDDDPLGLQKGRIG